MRLAELTFTWEDHGDERYLFMGSWPEAVAWVRKRKKLWSAHVFLPGVRVTKEYAPLEEQLHDVTTQVRAFYEAAVVWPEK